MKAGRAAPLFSFEMSEILPACLRQTQQRRSSQGKARTEQVLRQTWKKAPTHLQGLDDSPLWARAPGKCSPTVAAYHAVTQTPLEARAWIVLAGPKHLSGDPCA